MTMRMSVGCDGREIGFDCEFAVVGYVSDDGVEHRLNISTFGGTTAFAASLLGCEIAAKLVEPFDRMEVVKTDDEGRCR